MIALDAMGGDFAPRAIVAGALRAARQGVEIVLFGELQRIEYELTQLDSSWKLLPLSIIDCKDHIGMADEPSRTVIAKKESSLVQAVLSVKNGETKAVVSAGNSGALLVASTLYLGRVPGVLRPAIGSYIPTLHGSVFCLDLGANTDCKPEFLEQFAYMGSAYVSATRAVKQPKVALLSNGHEPYKGSVAVKKTYELLEKSSLNFIGNIEPRDIFTADIDVVVADGFVGNVMLKTMQGAANLVTATIKKQAELSLLSKIYLAIGSSIFGRVKSELDYSKRGGALLLGVKAPVVFAHGSSNERAIEQAILFAHGTVKNNVLATFNEHLQQSLKATSVASPTTEQEIQSNSL